MVTKSKGFPLALEVVGRSLYGQSVEIWRSTSMKLCEGQSIVNYEDEVHNCLKSSLDALCDYKDIILVSLYAHKGILGKYFLKWRLMVVMSSL